MGTLSKKLFLDSKIYKDINNVTLPTRNGTTQIDHIIVSRFGIFVVETKNIDGWIYGGKDARQWTQNLYGKKFRFQNPLHQNYRHTKALADFLDIEHDKFHSLVMFWGECRFKTPMPENVIMTGYTGYIKSKDQILFTDDEVLMIVEKIKAGRAPKTWKTSRKHVKELKERFASTTTCPKCGGDLLKRIARRGPKAGSRFLACSNFPKCKYTRDL